MKGRYRLKLSFLSSQMKVRILGISFDLQKVVPNAFVFVAYLTEEQLQFQVAAVGFLAPFGIGLEVEPA